MMNIIMGNIGTPVYGKTADISTPEYVMPKKEPAETPELQLQQQREQLQQRLSQMNEEVSNIVRSLRFTYVEETGSFVVEIVDLKTQEVLETIPPEYLIKLSIQMKEMLGLFLDRKL